MARGNRDSGRTDITVKSGEQHLHPGQPVAVYVRLPPELDWVVREYQIASRMPSLGYAMQSLLETHPLIVAFAQRLYNEPQASPGGTRESS